MSVNEVPPRFTNLPLPPSLTKTVEENKKRIKLIEKVLKAHKSKPCLDDQELEDLTKELQELKTSYKSSGKATNGAAPGNGDAAKEPPSSSAPDASANAGYPAEVGGAPTAPVAAPPAATKAKAKSSVKFATKATAAGGLASLAEEAGEAEGEDSADKQRLRIKKSIREFEKQIKQHKKKPFMTNKEVADMTQKLEELQVELLNIQDWNPVVLNLSLHEHLSSSKAGEEPQITGLKVASQDRISVVGLSPKEAQGLLDIMNSQHDKENITTDEWEVWRHHALQTGAINSTEPTSLSKELADLADRAPHVVVLRTRSLSSRGGAVRALRTFLGAVVLLEENDEEAGEDDAPDAACLLHAMGVTARYSKVPGGYWEPLPVPAPPQGDVLGDLKLRDLKENADLSEMLTVADALCVKEFDETLLEVLTGDVIRLGLLIEVLPEEEKKKKPPRKPAFLGFITYKFWGPPLKAMSISRVAVPKKYQMQGFGRLMVRWAIEKAKAKPRIECDRVTLSAIPKARLFYEHMNFDVVVDNDLPDDDDGPCKEDAVRMEYRLGAQKK